ncbi:MAG: OadG family protein [Bacteroidales bacterium]|nr:OadG family protein [Bacteroidales bacterium]
MIANITILKSYLPSEAIIIAIVGYLVVFASLVLLFWFFSIIPKILYYKNRKGSKQYQGGRNEAPDHYLPGETVAAISMALHLHLSELHDEESGVLTIKKVSKTYSPWSSKIYAVRNQFNRK